MKVTSPQSGSRFQPRKLSRTNSALILPKRRIASTAAACIWVTSDLPSSPLIVALIMGPDVSMIVNAIVPPLDFSQQREIVVKYKPIIVLTVFGTLILDARCYNEIAPRSR